MTKNTEKTKKTNSTKAVAPKPATVRKAKVTKPVADKVKPETSASNDAAPEVKVKKKPGREPNAPNQVDTSLCMITEVREYLGRFNPQTGKGRVVAEEIRNLVLAADIEKDVVERVRSGRNRQTEDGSKRRNIRLPIEIRDKFQALGGSSWLRVAVEKEMYPYSDSAAENNTKKTRTSKKKAEGKK